MPNKGKNQPIAEQLPLKQGLKLCPGKVHPEVSCYGIAEQLPVKKGLKHFKTNRKAVTVWNNCRTASSKTRIETLDVFHRL